MSFFRHAVRRWFPPLVLLTAVTFLPWLGAEEDHSRDVQRGETGAAVANRSPQVTACLRREGTTLTNVTGRFEVQGERVVFREDASPEPVAVLENLALERVQTVLEVAGERSWLVSGSITEYCGRNYLFLTRAVVRAAEGAASARALSDLRG